jgi:hypothetical protein
MDPKSEISGEEQQNDEGAAAVTPTAKKPTKQSSKKRRKNKMNIKTAEEEEAAKKAPPSPPQAIIIPEEQKPALLKKNLSNLESSINKSCVLMAQHIYVEKTQALNKKIFFPASNRAAANSIRRGFVFSYPPPWAFLGLDPSNKVDINTLVFKHNEKLEGKFLVARTIAPATFIDQMIIAAVEDEGMNHAVRLAIRFFSPEAALKGTDFDMVLPPGAFLVVNNPFFYKGTKGSILKVDNTFEVEMISMKALKNKFPGKEFYFYFIFYSI